MVDVISFAMVHISFANKRVRRTKTMVDVLRDHLKIFRQAQQEMEKQGKSFTVDTGFIQWMRQQLGVA